MQDIEEGHTDTILLRSESMQSITFKINIHILENQLQWSGRLKLGLMESNEPYRTV